MRPKIIFCIVVSAATLAVILLALISPVAHRKSRKNQTRPLALSLYIQQPHTRNPNNPQLSTSDSSAGAFIFHHTLTHGPDNTSRIIGKAQVLACKRSMLGRWVRRSLLGVGGTGYFAFARGHAIFAQTGQQTTDIDAMYHLRLRLRLPGRVSTVSG
ncbi:hypothetical protein GIB67_005423 [Kingdonia uniflora]|uniref:Dirigent protein n=1 Tax=Kingdonia uniflora TaxID=39325 RepID=A0A7J7NH43_9MAGN|nr:hypothetical protein GIB67_005423 [Kingdonia uniflora]